MSEPHTVNGNQAPATNLREMNLPALVRQIGDEISHENALMVAVDGNHRKVFIYIT